MLLFTEVYSINV